MDFARRQLEKYGWSDGKGLGRHENGISEPLRPKLKRSVAGLGHDAAAEHNDHWWSNLYDRAASNVEVKNKTEISAKDADAFAISSSTWKIGKKSRKTKSGGMEGFVRKAVLTSGGVKTERIEESSDSEPEFTGMKLTDEELFAACGGRTAHKGARHGLRAIGKLARIEQQEKNLLKQARYKGYSQAVENASTEPDNHELNQRTGIEQVKCKKDRKSKKNKSMESSIEFKINEEFNNIETMENAGMVYQNEIIEETRRKKKKKPKKNSKAIEINEVGNEMETGENEDINDNSSEIHSKIGKKHKRRYEEEDSMGRKINKNLKFNDCQSKAAELELNQDIELKNNKKKKTKNNKIKESFDLDNTNEGAEIIHKTKNIKDKRKKSKVNESTE